MKGKDEKIGMLEGLTTALKARVEEKRGNQQGAFGFTRNRSKGDRR